jgi:nitrate reductase (NAD(P)H)
VHPFNVEAPLTALYDEGFLTSPELFYVRNHGAVPQVGDEDALDWEFSIEGFVESPGARSERRSALIGQ